jgi:hypothetical protein
MLLQEQKQRYYEENNQQNALIVSLINLLIYNYSNMFRLPSFHLSIPQRPHYDTNIFT